MEGRNKTCLVDCDAGRRIGCATFCCRMLVRLQPDEMEQGDGITPPKGFIDKDPDGFCIHFNKDSGLCDNWEKRPKVCREYECNSDFMLQVVLLEGFTNIAELAKASVKVYIPKESYTYIPVIEASDKDKHS